MVNFCFHFIFSNRTLNLIPNYIKIKVSTHIVQKMKFSMKDFFSICDQIISFLRILSHLLKKALMENIIFLCNAKEKYRFINTYMHTFEDRKFMSRLTTLNSSVGTIIETSSKSNSSKIYWNSIETLFWNSKSSWDKL